MLAIAACLLAPVAHGHPGVDAHLHEPPAPCTDPDAGDASRIRRAGILTDAARFDEALAELDAACQKDSEMVLLARARTTLKAGRPQATLDGLRGLEGPDAALWRAQALIALGRDDEAGALLALALPSLADAPPQAYLDAAERLGPEAGLQVLLLGLERRGDVGTLRRGAATAEAALGRLDAAAARLSPTHVADLTLLGDLLAPTDPAGARRAWTRALDQLDTARDTPANADARKTLLQRLDTP